MSRVRGLTWVGAWVLSRAVIVWLLLTAQSWVTGDLHYFADSLSQVHQAGLGDTLTEYPLPAVAVVAVPWLLARLFGDGGAYVGLMVTAALLTDAAFAGLLARWGGRRRVAALLVWVAGVPLLGTTAYARFDILPGVLVGVALLTLSRRPAVAACCAALATGVKLWPALLLPGLVAGARRRGRVLAVLGSSAAVLGGGSLALAGWDRLVSPLGYQADRGLQIESVVATPAMAAWSWDPVGWDVWYSSHHAYEVTGPGVLILLGFAAVASAGFVLLLAAAWWRAFRLRDRLPMDGVVWLSLAAVTGFVVTGKVLSPQYLLWLLPAAAAGLVVAGDAYPRLLRWCGVLLAATALTQLVFPTLYRGLVFEDASSGWAVLVLAVRNVLLVWLFVRACSEVWSVLRDAQRGRPLERQAPGPEGNEVRILR